MQAAAEATVNWSYQFDLSELTVCELKLPEETKYFEAEWGKYGVHSEQAGEGAAGVAPPAGGDHQAGEQQQGRFKEGELERCGH